MSAEAQQAYLAALREHAENMPEDACRRCQGDGKLADDEDGSPWHVWELMPAESAMARDLGIVNPVDCPVCAGSGKRVDPELLESCEGCATSLIAPEPCPEHGTQYRDALIALDRSAKVNEIVEDFEEEMIGDLEGADLQPITELVYDLEDWSPDPGPALVEHLLEALAGSEEKWLREMGDAVAVSYRDLAVVIAEAIPFKAVGLIGAARGLFYELDEAVAIMADPPEGSPPLLPVSDWPEGVDPAFILEGVKVRPPIVDPTVGQVLADEMVEVTLPGGETVKVPAASVRPAR